MCSFDDIVEDGAPTGSSDPDYARGFRDGQEYGLGVGFDAGVVSERQRITRSLSEIQGEVSWDFENQIQQLITELKGEQK